MLKFSFLFRHSPVTLIKYTFNRLIYSYKVYVEKNRYHVKKIFGYKMLLDMEDLGLSRALMFFGQRELEHKYILERYLRKGDTVLDLGANIGYYANMEAEIVGDEGRVIAIEPNPDNLRLLELNLLLNHNKHISQVVHGAGGNEDGIAELFLSDKSNLHSFIRDANSNGSVLSVPMFSMKTIIEKFGEFDFLRMDIEGFEVNVLESLLETLPAMSKKPGILFETHLPKYSNEFNLKTSMAKLFENGYKATAIASNEGPKCSLRMSGYRPSELIKTDGRLRGIYHNVTNEDAIKFVNELGGVRAIFLSYSATS